MHHCLLDAGCFMAADESLVGCPNLAPAFVIGESASARAFCCLFDCWLGSPLVPRLIMGSAGFASIRSLRGGGSGTCQTCMQQQTTPPAAQSTAH